MPPYHSSKIAEGARYGTLEDVELIYRISRSAQYKLIGAGKIVARKMGARTIIDLGSVDAHMASLPEAKIAPPKDPAVRS